MHIIKMTRAKNPRQDHTKKGSLLMGMNHIITFPQQQLDGFQEHQNIQENLGLGGSNADVLDRFNFPNPVNFHIRKLDIRANMICYQIDFMSKRRERFQSLINTDRSTTWFKERLR